MQLKHAGRSVMVELNPAVSKTEDAGSAAAENVRSTEMAADSASQSAGTRSPAGPGTRPAVGRRATPLASGAGPDQRPPVEMPPQRHAEGVRVVGRCSRNATGARWPMYLRNVKQILAAPTADVRRTPLRLRRPDGSAARLPARRARRLERDRRGGLRVFQGAGLARGATVTATTAQLIEASRTRGSDAQPRHLVRCCRSRTWRSEIGPIPIVNDGGLCWDARRRRSARSRLGARGCQPVEAPVSKAGGPRARKPAARKATAPRRAARAKKDAAADASESTE